MELQDTTQGLDHEPNNSPVSGIASDPGVSCEPPAGWTMADALTLLAAAAIFVAHALLFGRWIIDDAGISFTYARNLAEGHGLVSHPGMTPVEGYSNFLWVSLLAPFFRLGLFDVVWTPKLVSIALVVGAYGLIFQTLRTFRPSNRVIIFAALALVSINTSFVVWSVSGLENPLYVFLICLLLWVVVRNSQSDRIGATQAFGAASIAFGVALTRPEGIVFAALYPLGLLVAKAFGSGLGRVRRILAHSVLYSLVFGGLYAGFLAFRWFYFHDIWPNVFYAKTQPTLDLDLFRFAYTYRMVLDDLGKVLLGSHPWIWVVALAGLTVVVAVRKRFTWRHAVLGLFLVWTLAVYLILPRDWMEECRFATPFFPIFYCFAAVVTDSFLKSLRLGPAARVWISVGLLCCVAALSGMLFWGRSLAWSSKPSFPMSEVSTYFGRRFNVYAERLGVRDGSMLVPDAGGTLFYSKLKAHDLAGLTDRTIARTLQRGRNLRKFHDYVFEDLKPTFIIIHGHWIRGARLFSDPRFERDYVPIRECGNPECKVRPDPQLYYAEYVRRDVIKGKAGVIQELRREFPGVAPQWKGPWIPEKHCLLDEVPFRCKKARGAGIGVAGTMRARDLV